MLWSSCDGLNEACDCCWGKCLASCDEVAMCEVKLEMLDHDVWCVCDGMLNF